MRKNELEEHLYDRACDWRRNAYRRGDYSRQQNLSERLRALSWGPPSVLFAFEESA